MTDKQRFLTRASAAEHLQERGIPIAASTLAKKATQGGGPPYRRIGRHTLYTIEDLDAWADSVPVLESAE